jgi:hypothetical protein
VVSVGTVGFTRDGGKDERDSGCPVARVCLCRDVPAGRLDSEACRRCGEVGRHHPDAGSLGERAVDDSTEGERNHRHGEGRARRLAGVRVDRRRLSPRQRQGRRQAVQSPGHGGRGRDGRIHHLRRGQRVSVAREESFKVERSKAKVS